MKMQANPSSFFFINLILVNLPSLTLVLFFFFCPMYHHVLCRDNKLI